MDRAELGSLRFSRTETERLLAALFISLCLHLGAWGGYEAGKQLHWWDALHLPAWLRHTAKVNPPHPAAPPNEAQSMIFVEVNQPDAEAPKNTKYYSDKNSLAANPDKDRDSNQPKLNGHQTRMAKTEDVQRFSKLMPSPTPPQQQALPQRQAAPAQTPTSPMNLGDVKFNQPAQYQKNGQDIQQQQPRPRTLKQAWAQQHLPGQQMQQSGGVHRIRVASSLDAKATPFGDYDAAMIAAIQQRWDDELDQHDFTIAPRGTVTEKFILNYDGSVTEIEATNNEVGVLLESYCRDAIQETQPYARWPSDMLNLIGSTQRPITLTFIYY